MANAAIRRGYGRDESEIIIEPGTPPALNEAAARKEGHDEDVTLELLQNQETELEVDNIFIPTNSINNTNVNFT